MPASSQRLSLALALSLLFLLPAQAEPSESSFTGLIIDARGWGVQRAMAPTLLAESGTALFPVIDQQHPFDFDFALSDGLALYAQSIEEAWKLKRLGGRPLVVKAAKVEGDELVFDEETAREVLEADYSAKFLEKNAVAIVY